MIKGVEAKSILEPTTIIATIVYALKAYAIVRLLEIYGSPRDREIR